MLVDIEIPTIQIAELVSKSYLLVEDETSMLYLQSESI